MILEDELNLICDLGSLSFYDSNPRTEQQLRDPEEIQKCLKYNLNKLRSQLIAHQKNEQIEQEIRPLAAQVIDFDKSKSIWPTKSLEIFYNQSECSNLKIKMKLSCRKPNWHFQDIKKSQSTKLPKRNGNYLRRRRGFGKKRSGREWCTRKN